MLSDREFTRRMLQTVFTVAGVSMLLVALWVAREVLLLVYVSALIAMGFSPLVHRIEQPARHVPRWLAILAIYLVVVGAFIVVGLLVVPPLAAQAVALWARMPTEFSHVQTFLIRHHLMARRVTLEQAVQSAPTGTGGNAVGTVLVAISSAIDGIFGLITVLILSFYLLIEAGPLFQYFVRFVPAGRRVDVAIASRQAVSKVSAWLRAQLLLAGVMGGCAAVVLGLMSVPYFYVVALIAAVGEMIPIVGPIIAGVTAVAIAISVSPKMAIAVGVFFVALHQLESNVLVPKLMERRVGVSPVAVIIALLIGGALWGLTGAILAVPTTAILAVVIDELTGVPETTGV
ncbi:MAG: AI-2E family transporter [Betaproteobacteria bacterium]